MTEDGDFSVIGATGPPEISYPLKDHPEHYVIKQKMMVKPADYAGPPLDTAHASYSNAYCVGDESPSLSGPVRYITRKWATVPSEQNLSGVRAVTFPAFGSSTASAAYELDETGSVVRQRYGDFQPRSSPLTLSVPVRRHVFYALPGVSGGFATLEDIPVHARFRVADVNGSPLASLETAGAVPDVAAYKAWIASKVEIVAVGTIIAPYLGTTRGGGSLQHSLELSR